MTEIDLSKPGPLDRPTALAALNRADQLLETGELAGAAALYRRVVGFPEVEITAAALHGLATALFRLDREPEALNAWQQLTQLGDNSKTYDAWRQIAGIQVRAGDLNAAREAYRRAERLAPPADRAEIASRLGWLAKETGDRRAASRYFSRSRDVERPPIVTYGIIGITVLISLVILYADPSGDLGSLLILDKAALASGEYWRLLSPLLVHVSLLHLAFNMYALWFAGQIVERLYGSKLYLVMYILCGAAGSIGSFVLGGSAPSAGASGAIFGLFGILFAAQRAHHPMLDRRGQAVLGQMGMLIAINLVIGFAVPGIDILAHLGGLVGGLWLGFLLVPGGVPTLASMWQRPGGTPVPAQAREAGQPLIRAVAVLVLAAAIIVGLVLGTALRHGRAIQVGSGTATLSGIPSEPIVATAKATATATAAAARGAPSSRA